MACRYTPYVLHDDGGVNSGGGDLFSLTLEHGHAVYCYQDHYGPVSGGIYETGSKGVQEVVGTEQGGCGRDTDSGLGCVEDGGGRR